MNQSCLPTARILLEHISLATKTSTMMTPTSALRDRPREPGNSPGCLCQGSCCLWTVTPANRSLCSTSSTLSRSSTPGRLWWRPLLRIPTMSQLRQPLTTTMTMSAPLSTPWSPTGPLGRMMRVLMMWWILLWEGERHQVSHSEFNNNY